MCKPWCTFVFPALLLNLSGTRSFLVRRHVGHGAPGSHPVLRETQQSGRHLRHSEAAEDYELTEIRRNAWKDQKCEERSVKPDQSASTLMAGPWTLTGHLTNQDHTARPLTPLSPALMSIKYSKNRWETSDCFRNLYFVFFIFLKIDFAFVLRFDHFSQGNHILAIRWESSSVDLASVIVSLLLLGVLRKHVFWVTEHQTWDELR